ncbi:MAG: biopolymer transport protein ExbD [Verrucomicrobia bacterium]|jgi:biopolymer transport protein ExbD|nr:MAG: biopolymer transport protein ExbD [Verrucomicrobiota bacterium]
MKSRRREETPAEMQIAPMADIGFLLLCFFIVSAKPPRHEADIGMTLPGSVSDQVSVDLPEEVRVAIHPDGAVEVNDAILGEPADQELRVLRETLQRFRESADNNHTQSLVTLDAANQTTHQRIVDVLNACARARIKGVTLNSDDETEEAE